MVPKVQDAEALYDVLERWQAAVNAQQPERMSEVFAEDAVFQGLRPYSVGHQGIHDYIFVTAPGHDRGIPGTRNSQDC